MYKLELDHTKRFHSFTFRKQRGAMRGWLYQIAAEPFSLRDTSEREDEYQLRREWYAGTDTSSQIDQLYAVVESTISLGWMRRPDEPKQAEWIAELASPMRKGKNSWLAYGEKRFYHKCFFMFHNFGSSIYSLYGVFRTVKETKDHLPDARTMVLGACVKYPKYFVSEFNTYEEPTEIWHTDR